MIQVQVEYFPVGWYRWRHFFNRKVFRHFKALEYSAEVPQKLDEFSPKDLRALVKARYLLQDRTVQKVFLIRHFLKLPTPVFMAMSLADVKQTYRHLDRLLGKSLLTTTVIKELRVNLSTFHGPEHRAANIRFLEFIKADQYYDEFIRNGQMSALHKLAAVLYRPASGLTESHPHFDGDVRVPFNEHHVADRAKVLSSASKTDLYCILIQYSGLRKWLQLRYPNVFAGGGKSKFGMGGVIVSLAGDKFGHDDEVARKLLHPILIHLEQCSLDAKRKS